MSRLGIGAAATVAAALVVAGCGVEPQDRATAVPDGDVPFALLEVDDAPPPTTTPTGLLVSIHLLSDEGLVPVERRVPDGDLTTVIDLLLEGASEEETAAGLRSGLSVDATGDLLGQVSLARGVATVDLSEAFAELTSEAQLEAIAQLVLTLTDRPGVGQVAFTLEGSSIDVPRGDGTVTGGAVTRGDYRDLTAPME